MHDTLQCSSSGGGADCAGFAYRSRQHNSRAHPPARRVSSTRAPEPTPPSDERVRGAVLSCRASSNRGVEREREREPYYEQPRLEDEYKWASHLSQRESLRAALEDAVVGALGDYGTSGPDPTVALVFASSLYAPPEFERLLPELRALLPSLKHVVGSTGYGVIGGGVDGPVEVEQAHALSLTLGHLPGCDVRTLHLASGDLPDADASPAAWSEALGQPLEGHGAQSFLLLADPGFMEVSDLTAGLDYAWPAATKLGGLASAALFDTGRRALFRWSEEDSGAAAAAAAADEAAAAADGSGGNKASEANEAAAAATGAGLGANGGAPGQGGGGGGGAGCGVYYSGCVVMSVAGDVAIEPIIAQGCRPLGSGVYTVDKCVNNVILQVSQAGWRGTPLQLLSQELEALDPDEKSRVARNLMVGLAPDDFKPQEELGPRDYLIRQIIGLVPAQGAVAVGDAVRVGQRFRFMVRDREGAMHDMVEHGMGFKKRQLQGSLEGTPLARPLGCLLFSCNGRGVELYGQPHYDSRTLTGFVPAPASGFMCNGEIGQVGGTTYLHGFTCAAGILRRVAPSEVRDSTAGTGDIEGAPNSDAPSSADDVE